jgi:hypothetical protein
MRLQMSLHSDSKAIAKQCKANAKKFEGDGKPIVKCLQRNLEAIANECKRFQGDCNAIAKDC